LHFVTSISGLLFYRLFFYIGFFLCFLTGFKSKLAVGKRYQLWVNGKPRTEAKGNREE
jgi:hypothetical protein